MGLIKFASPNLKKNNEIHIHSPEELNGSNDKFHDDFLNGNTEQQIDEKVSNICDKQTLFKDRLLQELVAKNFDEYALS